jgi:hypothetical protein
LIDQERCICLPPPSTGAAVLSHLLAAMIVRGASAVVEDEPPSPPTAPALPAVVAIGAAGVNPATIEIALGGVIVRVRGDADPRALTTVKALRRRMIVPTISASGAMRMLVATKPVDFRKHADNLAALVQDALGSDPFSGAV